MTNLRVLDRPIPGFRQDFCFAVQEGDRETLALLNEGLSIVMADGTYRHLHAEWFGSLQLPADRRIVVGGDSQFPPFEYLDENGRPAGYNVDLTRAIAREMGISVEIRLAPWAKIRESLAEGEIDALQGMFYSAERDLRFDFTQTHTVVPYVAVVRRGNAPPASEMEELAEQRMVVQRDDIMHDFIRENGFEKNATAVNSQKETLRQLAAGRYDCALISRMGALYLIDKHGWDSLVVGNEAIISPQYCYAVANNQKALLAQFSEGLKVLEKSGEYRRIHDRWFGVYERETVSLSEVLGYAAMIIGPLLLILLLVLFWIWSVRKQVSQRTEELRNSLEYQRAMISCSPVALFSIDPKGTVLTWNASAERMFGWSAEAAIGKTLPIVPGDKQEEFAGLRKQVMSGDQFTGKELWRQRKDGTRFPMSLSVAPIRNEEGQPVAIMGVAQDITDRHRRQQHILRLNSLVAFAVGDLGFRGSHSTFGQ
jgi:PAS domain S-box-containing protein